MAAIGGASLGLVTGYAIMDQETGQVKTISELFEGGVNTGPNSLTSTKGSFASRSSAAQFFFAYPKDTPVEDMYDPSKQIRVAEIGSVPEDISGSGREVVYIKGTASPGADQFEKDFVIKVYLNEDGTTSVGIGETGAELHENGDVTGSIWGDDGLKAYIDNKLP